MSNLQNFKHRSHTNFLTGVGQKVKHLSEIGAQLKTLYDVGKAGYVLGEAAAPYLIPLLGL